MKYYIKNATIVNEGKCFEANVYIADGKIAKIVLKGEFFDAGNATVIDATGKYLIPGIIDEHVHFREPGLTQKADIYTESRAAVAGGVTSFMDMPNTVPQTVTHDLLQQKFDIAAEKFLANYSFYLGATNDNLDEVAKINPKEVCGVKLFMGSSTGNMLVDQTESLERLFKEAPCLIAAHCEEESIIKQNTQLYKELSEKGEIKADATIHPLVRSAEACYQSSAKAVELAERTGARLHIMHISTAKELSLFRNDISIENKKITAETCPHYLFFNDKNYEDKGFAIKCNPAIKSATDQQALQQALTSGLIDTIGTDHAPHLREEKFTGDYFTAKSGFPSIQNSLNILLLLYKQDKITLPQIVNLMAHHPALLYQIDRRGFIREGYYADLAIVDLNITQTIRNEDMHYKCGWTPYNGTEVYSRVTHTFVNGNLVYENGVFHEESKGEKLKFCRSGK
ncbi:MAG: dihydroorotase [Bacteroidales bacterium]|nr:dihydroorotase [Bacteroidales bacterium]